jgi:hypothetical protein
MFAATYLGGKKIDFFTDYGFVFDGKWRSQL